MPQKKNPDVLEILRAKYHTVRSCEREVEDLISNLSTGFHRDFQLTKGPTLKGISITLESLRVAALVVSEISVNKTKCESAMTDDLYATQKAYALVSEGVPFREAYRRVAAELDQKED